jgi:hypothetical protein
LRGGGRLQPPPTEERKNALRFAIEELKKAVPCQRDVEQCHHAKILQRRIAELQKELEEK